MSFTVNIKQHDASDCGAASLASVAAYYGLKLPLAKIRLYSGTDSHGTTIRGIIEAAEKFGLSAKGFKGKFTSLYKVPKPVILHLKKLNGLLHFVVLYKISRKYLHLMDPLDGRTNRVKFDDFNKEWTGYLIIVEPDSCFQKGALGTSVSARLFSIVKRDINEYAKAFLGSLLYILIALSTSVFIKYIIDDILPGRNREMLSAVSAAMGVLIIISFLLSYYKSRILLRLSINTDRRLIMSYLRHLFKLPQQFFDIRKTGELTSRVDDAFKIRSLLSDMAINASIAFLTLAVSFILLFTLFWRLALISLLFIPVYVLIYYLYDRFNKRIQREIMEGAAQFESTLIEGLKSIKTVKHFGIESFILYRIKERLVRLNDSLYKAGKKGITVSNLGESSSRILSLIVLWAGGTYVLSSSVTVGELFSFYTITALISSPLTALIGLNVSVREGLTAADRLFEIMDLDVEKYNQGVVTSLENSQSLKIENIAFSYPGREPLFCGLSMELNSGQITALCGESGCGKSTIASMIIRMQKPSGGTISLDGVNIDHINLELWREWVTIVPQNSDLFGGSIIENIALGEADPDFESIIDLCRETGLLDFIEKLPSGFETQVGEGGSFLSRGQQQRIAFARALYRKPKILILDEASSSLDSHSRDLIDLAVGKARERGTMILLISHMESNINSADKIFTI